MKTRPYETIIETPYGYELQSRLWLVAEDSYGVKWKQLFIRTHTFFLATRERFDVDKHVEEVFERMFIRNIRAVRLKLEGKQLTTVRNPNIIINVEIKPETAQIVLNNHCEID